TLIRKTSLLRDRSDVRAVKQRTTCIVGANADDAGDCAHARDFLPPGRSERSPLHDVRKPARRIRDAREKFASGRETRLVEPDGIEPTTSCLQGRRSPS